MSTPHFHLLRIKEVRPETAECVSVSFDIPESLKETFHFLPGQYLTLRTNIDGVEVRRSYSICSAPGDELRVAVKKVDQGKFSGFVNEGLKAGDTLEVMPPLGKFTPRSNEKTAKKYLAFAAGSGITPVIGIMKTVLQQEPESEFTLVYGNKNRGSIIFKEGIEALKNKYMERLRIYHVFTRETMDTPLFNGRINTEKAKMFCERLIDLEQIDEIFICGPEDMILGLRDYFIEERKMPAQKVHFELFSSPDQPRAVHKDWEEKQQQIDHSKMSRVTVRLDGAAFEMDLAYGGNNILDEALRQGADLPYACKGGVCSTCKAKLVSGEVDMEVNYALEPDELAANFILTCQSHPRTEKVVVDFDIK
ncbi:1,2-phenylacetyl-CoA epoxidase subunit PaaE [Taibaiella koreensis]|uniref:1,2-phenylacetyl-CoA epoxidase subunit PaaE n=1 Tax=Taibaiella koreensis TaxID=1268548 RepID=UPI000E599EA1|nr:1,2-phenylacetyl-CoA epoxidase subunit PaaE [Taibaiella koreensis]